MINLRDPRALVDFAERIALAKDFSPGERKLILDLLSVNVTAEEHQYPSLHGPGSDPYTTVAWEILDTIKPSRIDNTVRFLIAGMIAGALKTMFDAGQQSAQRQDAQPEVYVPKNPGGQIDALYAMLSVDPDGAEGLCAGPIGLSNLSALVVTERRHVDLIRDIARAIGHAAGKKVVLARFTLRETLEEIKA